MLRCIPYAYTYSHKAPAGKCHWRMGTLLRHLLLCSYAMCVRLLPGCRYVPILAGSAVGRKASSRQTVKARGQFQTFDTKRGWVENQAR